MSADKFNHNPLAIAFYTKACARIQVELCKVLNELSDEASTAKVGIAVVSQALGYACANVVLQITTDPENPLAPLSDEEIEGFKVVGKHLHEAFEQALVDYQTNDSDVTKH